MRTVIWAVAAVGALWTSPLAFGQGQAVPQASLNEDELAVIQNIELLLNLEVLSELELTQNIDLLLIDLESEELISPESEGNENE